MVKFHPQRHTGARTTTCNQCRKRVGASVKEKSENSIKGLDIFLVQNRLRFTSASSMGVPRLQLLTTRGYPESVSDLPSPPKSVPTSTWRITPNQFTGLFWPADWRRVEKKRKGKNNSFDGMQDAMGDV